MTSSRDNAPPGRRQLLAGLSGVALAGMAPWARAQTTAPLRIVVGFAAGGSADTTARLVAEQLRVQLGRTVIVDNRAGASGRIAIEAVKAARPDGDTLMMVPHGPMTLFPHIYKALKFDPAKDFTPIGRICTFDYALATGPATGARTVAAFRAWAEDPARKPSFGTPGAGTVPHFIGLAFARKTGLALTPVPYRGAAPSMIDLIGGAVSAAIAPLADASEHHKAGKIRILATTGETRSDIVQNVPTLRESGVDLALDGWYGLYGPAGLAPATTQALNAALVATARSAREPLARLGLRAAATSPEQLSRIQQAEAAFWGPLVQSSGFQAED